MGSAGRHDMTQPGLDLIIDQSSQESLHPIFWGRLIGTGGNSIVTKEPSAKF